MGCILGDKEGTAMQKEEASEGKEILAEAWRTKSTGYRGETDVEAQAFSGIHSAG